MNRTILIFVVLAIVGGIAAGVATEGDTETRQDEIRERGAAVMPFSLDATTHVFQEAPFGGVQRVRAEDPRDRDEIRLIREHLREEAAAFARGDFDDPAKIHGERMPGLSELEAGHERIDVRYENTADGAQITYRTSDRSLTRALHRWFDAQLNDHGADAQRGGEPPSRHPDHSHDEG